jgi:ABC-2 type transport system ATP-binding protein
MVAPSNSVMLDVQGLCKSFGAFQALKDLSFEVRRGDVFGFLGPNGAGKTTTMRIVTCFMPASRGSIRVDGLDTREHDLEVRRKIGYLPEANPLYLDMLVEEYLQYSGAIRGITGERLTRRLAELYETCGLGTMRRRQLGKLSKGYSQRVVLAQSLLHDPDLLILDEPTSGLDPNQIIEIRQLIKNVGRSKTVIYCSHILSEVSATCNRIMIINEGRTVAAGTPAELMNQSNKGNRYLVRVKGDKDGLLRAMGAIAGVSSARLRATAGEWHEVEVLAASSADIGESIFDCVVQNRGRLAELKHETASLEDVFIQLTKG